MPSTRENDVKRLSENSKAAGLSWREGLELTLAVYKMSFFYLAVFIGVIAAFVWLFTH